MKTYKVDLQVVDKITQLPDSHKIFGALMYLLSESENGREDIAGKLVENVRDGKSILSLSNLLPDGYLPTPKEYLLEQYCNDRSRVDYPNLTKEIQRDYKIRDFIRIEDCINLLKGTGKLHETFPFVNLDFVQRIRVGIDSDKYDIPGMENKLFSIPAVEPVLIETENQHESSVITEYCFYLSLGESDEEKILYEVLCQAAKCSALLILGKRSSQGYNMFEIKKISEHRLPNVPNGCTLNTGMLLPWKEGVCTESLDYDHSVIRLFTSERRPFDVPYGWRGNTSRNFISFIAAGSILAWRHDIEPGGYSIQAPYNSDSIIFGGAFQYPLEITD